MLATEGGEQILQKINKLNKKRVYEAIKLQRKQKVAYETHKFAGVMHAVVVADGALEAKCARDSSHWPFLKGSRSEQIAIRTTKRATRASINDKKSSF